MRFALIVKFRQRQGTALDIVGMQACEGLIVALVRYPDVAKIGVISRPVRIRENSREGATG